MLRRERSSGKMVIIEGGGRRRKESREGPSKQNKVSLVGRKKSCRWCEISTNLEEINRSLSVNSGVLEDGGDDGTLSVLLRVESGSEVELEALSEVVLELNLSSEDVGGGPDLKQTAKQGWGSAKHSTLGHERSEARAGREK